MIRMAEYMKNGTMHTNPQNEGLPSSSQPSTGLLIVQFGFVFLFNN